LVFPYAEYNLDEYWQEENPKPSKDDATLLWMFRQCYGIAIGLKHIHHLCTMLTDSIKVAQEMPVSERPRAVSDSLVLPVTWWKYPTSWPGCTLFGQHNDI
jgi:hypothetical protein